MIDIMIVDDELDILYGARSIICWNDLGFNLCKLCSSSSEAIDVFKCSKPEIVITDIRMPGIDGLELASVLKRECSDTKVIILSGYDDFIYAKSAIDIGVSGYLLKPLDETELTTLLEQLKEEIQQQQFSKMRREEFEKRYSMADNALNHKLLSHILFNEMPEKEQTVRLDLKSAQIIVAKPDTPFVKGYTENAEFEIVFKKLSIFLKDEASLYYEQLFEETAIYVIEAPKRFVLDKERLVQQNITGEFSMIISPIVTDVKKLGDMLKNICIAFDIDRLFGRPGSVYRYTSMPSNSIVQPIYDFSFKKYNSELSEAMLSLNEETIKELFSRYLEEIRANREHISPEMASEFWQRLVVFARDIFAQMFHADLSIMEDFDYGCYLIKHLPSMEAIADHLFSLITCTLHLIYDKSWNNMAILIRQIILYVRMNACDEISLKQVANKFFLNPSYFSRIFKEKTGTAFWAYVTEIRMTKAKEMLNNECNSYNDIAIECGFKSLKRLYAVFKKQLGCTPGAYRKQLKEKKEYIKL